MKTNASLQAAPKASDRRLQPLAKPRRVAIVTGALAPYTHRLFNKLSEVEGFDVTVLSCTKIEPHRQWKIDGPASYRLVTMRGLALHRSAASHIYLNPAVIWHLAKLRPCRILLDGFSPTMLLASLYGRLTRSVVGINTDGSMATDPGARSTLHRWARKLTVPSAHFGVAASEDGRRVLMQYGLAENTVSIVRIPAAWDGPSAFKPFHERPYDLLFCGALNEERKGALFFADVAAACQQRLAQALGRPLKVRVVGDGAARAQMEQRLLRAGVDVRFDGYQRAPSQLRAAYESARLFLLPSREEPWGLVVNEAILCGTPVIGSPHAVASVELVERYQAGSVLPLESQRWTDEACRLLLDRQEWERLQSNHRRAAASFAVEKSAKALADALARQPM